MEPTRSECASRSCTEPDEVQVQFIDPFETEQYCEEHGIDVFQRNEKAVSVAMTFEPMFPEHTHEFPTNSNHSHDVSISHPEYKHK